MSFNVKRGTPTDHTEWLCESCNASVIMQDDTGRVRVYCTNLTGGRQQLNIRVVRCNSYHKAAETSLRDMEKVAWVVRTDANKVIGFRPQTEEERRKSGRIFIDD